MNKGALPTGWERKNLGGLITLQYGKPLAKEERSPDGHYPAYGANGVKDRTDSFYYDKPSIIVGRKGSAGELTLTEDRFWPLDVTYFVEFDNTKFDLKFIYNLLLTLQLPKLAKGVKPGINRNDVYAIDVAYPPIPEQQRIVGVLDDAFASIAIATAHAEQNLLNARELFDSTLNAIFTVKGEGWVVKTLEKCFRLRSGDGLTSKSMIDGEFPVFGGNGVAGMHNKFNLSGDYVIVGRVGALCGNARHITEKIWLTDNAFKIVDFKYQFNNAFLTYLLNHKNLRNLARQAAQPVISNSSLKDLELSFPVSVNEQKEIVTKLDTLAIETKRLEAIYQQKLAALVELKQSLLQQAFAGEL